MFNVTRKDVQWAGRTLTLETGKIARQADGAVVATYGDTQVLATVVAAREIKEGQDFFPLGVFYQEKTFAAGKIPGGFFKREGRPSEKETLTSRLIDRPIRPLFPKKFLNETQIICTVISHDLENDPDMVAMVATSAALTISGIPFLGPIGGARVGYIDGKYVVNPTELQKKESSLNLIVAGTKEGVLMVESEAHELPEDIMLGAVMEGWNSFQPVIDTIISFAEECAKEPRNLPEGHPREEEVTKAIREKYERKFRDAYALQDKQERVTRLSEIKAEVIAEFQIEGELEASTIQGWCKEVEADIVRSQILETGKRIDGRDTKTVRQIDCQVGVFPRTHGSALFTRGETQALVVTTLGTGQDEQIIDALEGEYRERYLLHYNFPPYSVGEAGRMAPPGRREIGHGKLAWRATNPLLPDPEDFPYTIRVVSEITESNGSSSMATVCGASLAMMDAGVPLKAPVAGIAMGLIKEGDKFAVLSDILGDEDHLGDMDFKVAGTQNGITSLQMDIKITSITEEIMKIALSQAKDGRLHILNEMSKALTGHREELSQYAPQMESFTVPTDKIREIIGSGGSVIREITETTGAKIDIDDDGMVRIAAISPQALKDAVDWVKGIVAEPEIGEVYDGVVVNIVDFGAFVRFMPKRDGLVHISEISHKRVKSVHDALEEGQKVKVKCIGIDDRGRVKLSIKQASDKGDQDNGAPHDEAGEAAEA